MQQKRREQLLDVTAEDVKQVAQKYLLKPFERGNLAILGAQKGWVTKEAGWEVRDIGMEVPTVEVPEASELATAAA